MATNNDYLIYVLELLKEVDNISYRKMMGEYILYKNNVIFGGIYDNRFLVKNIDELSSYRMNKIIPYPNTKPMLLVDSEDSDVIKEIVNIIYHELSNK